jgi:NAD(P)H-flavin reductase/ferredoxin
MSAAGLVELLTPAGQRAQLACEAGANLLEAIVEAGWQVPHSCRRGVCLSCRARVVRGELQAPRTGDGQVLLCQAQVRGPVTLELAQLERARAPQRLDSQARIFRLHRPASDVAHLELRLPNGVHPHWQAGQYLELTGPDGVVRSYSMARPPLPDASLHLHIRLVPGGGFSGWLLQALQDGQGRSAARPPPDTLRVRLPFGALALPAGSRRPALLLASGTGFSALGAIAEEAIARGDARPLHLYWGARRPEDLYDLPRAQALARAHPALRLVPVLSEPPAQAGWTGRTGLVHHAVMEDFATLADVDVLACGAPAMLEAAERDFMRERAMPAANWRCDAFHPTTAPSAAAATLGPAPAAAAGRGA